MAQGFQHGKTYRVQSVFDGCMLDLSAGNTGNGNPIVTWERNNTQNQVWIINQEREGFRIACQKNRDPLAVIDINKRDFTLCNWHFHAGTNQQFYTESIGEGKVMIKSRYSNRAMRNQGRGVRVICAIADKNDISQQWYLQEI